MKAFVLAAGYGTRLRPLTFSLPKPMIPIVNKPALEHTLENLRKYGINDVVINLHSHPKMVRNYFGDGSKMGMNITYSYENCLMGTAGGVKIAEQHFDDTFFVLSGDGLTDINLQEVLDFHKAKRSFATMVLKRIDSRFQYGVTLINKSGKISKFLEKPSWSSVFANTVNTGIYVFEPEIFKFIPKNIFYDFGSQVWPALLKKKKKIYGFVTDSYWCDVGNIIDYRQGQQSALNKDVRVFIPGKELKPRVWVDKNTVIEKGVVLKSPCVIGKNCRIGRGAYIGKYTTIGSGSHIGEGAKLENCIIWNNVKVEKKVQLNNCIISQRAKITENISVLEGAVITVKRKGV